MITASTQHQHVLHLRLRRSSFDASAESDKTVISARTRVEAAFDQVAGTLEELSRLSGTASELHSTISINLGNLHGNPEIDAYSRSVAPEVFNYEYREYQRAAEIIASTAQSLRNESQMKMLQFKNCAATDYPRLLRTWTSEVAKDSEMDDLADLMLN